MDTYEVVLDFFTKAEQPVRTGDVVKATGIDKKEVEKVMNRLKKEGKIVSPKRCYWKSRKTKSNHFLSADFGIMSSWLSWAS